MNRFFILGLFLLFSCSDHDYYDQIQIQKSIDEGMNEAEARIKNAFNGRWVYNGSINDKDFSAVIMINPCVIESAPIVIGSNDSFCLKMVGIVSTKDRINGLRG